MLKDKAHRAIDDLSEVTLYLLKEHPAGLRVSEVSKLLEINSDICGKHHNWLARSILDHLVNTNRALSEKDRHKRIYRPLSI